MAAVLKTLLKKGSKTKEATDSYIDDIMVDVTKILTKEVVSWVTSTVEGSGRIRTKGAGEVIVKLRLGILGELISEFKRQIKGVFVPSE